MVLSSSIISLNAPPLIYEQPEWFVFSVGMRYSECVAPLRISFNLIVCVNPPGGCVHQWTDKRHARAGRLLSSSVGEAQGLCVIVSQ